MEPIELEAQVYSPTTVMRHNALGFITLIAIPIAIGTTHLNPFKNIDPLLALALVIALFSIGVFIANAIGAFRVGQHAVRVRYGDQLEIDGTMIPDELVKGAYIFIPDFIGLRLTLGARNLGEFGLRLETKTQTYTLCLTRSFLNRGVSQLPRQEFEELKTSLQKRYGTANHSLI